MTIFQYVSRRKTTDRNKATKRLAQLGATWEDETKLDTRIPDRFNLTGVELAQLTQASAYQIVKEVKVTMKQNTTKVMITKTQCGIEQVTGYKLDL